MEYNVIIIRFGEMSTKGKNRKDFIFKLAKSIKRNLLGFNKIYTMDVRHDHIYLYIDNIEEFDYTPLTNISGINSFSLAKKVEVFELEDLVNYGFDFIKEENGNTFKVHARRIDKSFP